MNRRREYDRIYRLDPTAANVWLILVELADERGQVRLGPDAEGEIAALMGVRFPVADGYYPPPESAKKRGRRG